jgi:inosine/xanthosine triphosphate pyrophosphatase family protein
MALRIVLATRNTGKIREIRNIFSGIDVELVGADAASSCE